MLEIKVFSKNYLICILITHMSYDQHAKILCNGPLQVKKKFKVDTTIFYITVVLYSF